MMRSSWRFGSSSRHDDRPASVLAWTLTMREGVAHDSSWGAVMAESRLEAVYNATSRDELSKAYDRWADSYDSDMAEVAYRHPAVGLALLTRYLARDSEPILDAGAGTGLIGELLGTMGYPTIDALD